ncbi:cytochrome P450 [Microdochium trichocladiopsis]|uniref:Cytochrome P450 n=1 Tax=Microdochium trichocladiopsis TaxID=1682393 RepID=A0A9P8Y6L1_9PEZI|nr:cytochrome P450 [Microdochium trichocladiopsis]KAH7029323.1 cytochrome P450 [Microdochium trichocladiopsis]
MLATDFASFGKGDRFHRVAEPFLGDGIFSTDGKLWHDSRNLIRPFFVNERVRDLEIFERGVQKLLTKLPEAGQTVEIMDLINRMTFDEITDFLLGASANSLDDPSNVFMQAFDTVQREQMQIFMMSPLDFLKSKKLYHSCVKTINTFLEPYIQQTLSLPTEQLEKLTKSDRDFTFLHGLATFTRDPKVIRDQLIAILLAGRDTTAATISWCLYELSAHPDKYTRLRQEVIDVVGRHEAPTYQTLKDMKYLRYTIQEILRLYPAVPVNVKMALKDTTLPATPNSGPIGVCKGDSIAWGPMNIQLREDLYPPTTAEFAAPHVFSPERWYVWQPKPWEYVPFNGGPRVCIGQNFANTEIAYTLVRFLQKYRAIEFRGDWSAQLRTADVVARPSMGVPLVLHEAADDE